MDSGQFEWLSNFNNYVTWPVNVDITWFQWTKETIDKKCEWSCEEEECKNNIAGW